MHIRLAQDDDLPIIQELNSLLFEHDREGDPNMNFEWPFQADGENYFRRMIAGVGGVCFVADDGRRPIGYLAGRMMTEPYRVTKRAEIENMFIEEHKRKSGVGRLLMETFFKWAREHGAEEAYVVGYYGNENAISFYEAMGFKRYSLALNTKL